MSFLSADYILFFPAAVLLYYAVPERFRRLWLLAASYIFYGLISVRFVPWLFGYTVLTFAGGILLSGRKGRAGSILLGVLLTLLFTILLSFKYLPEMPHSLVMPAGLSFFTFGAAGYLIDVKKGRVPERDFLSLALFLSFFPQLLSGPIARSHILLAQLEKPARFSREIPFTFAVMNQKSVEENCHTGYLLAMTENGEYALIRTKTELPDYTDLRINPDGRAYAKVLGREEDGSWRICFTQGSGAFRKWAEELREKQTPEAN